jgi:hypothetical protein
MVSSGVLKGRRKNTLWLCNKPRHLFAASPPTSFSAEEFLCTLDQRKENLAFFYPALAHTYRLYNIKFLAFLSLFVQYMNARLLICSRFVILCLFGRERPCLCLFIYSFVPPIPLYICSFLCTFFVPFRAYSSMASRSTVQSVAHLSHQTFVLRPLLNSNIRPCIQSLQSSYVRRTEYFSKQLHICIDLRRVYYNISNRDVTK